MPMRASSEAVDDPSRGKDGAPEKEGDPLERFAINLNKRARAGEIEPLVGRDNELRRVIQVLSRRRKNNPLFVGDAGVGKTAIVEGLAAQHRRQVRYRSRSQSAASTRSTWARCSRAPSTAATSRIA